MKKLNMPEQFDREINLEERSSDRSFGLVMTAFFLFLGAVSVIKGQHIRWWALTLSSLFLVCALVKPVLLRRLNLLWTKFGYLLQKITNPLIMGILFYGIVSPFALLLRLFGKDPIKKTFDSKLESYWVSREFEYPAKNMKNQF